MSHIPENMKQSIGIAATSAGAVGLFGVFVPHGDVGALSAIWTALLVTLANQAGTQMDKAKAVKVAAGVVLAIGGFVGGVKLAETYLAYTGIGTVPAMIANAGANATLTYLFGRSAAMTFLSVSSEASIAVIITAIVTAITGIPPKDGIS